VAGCGLAAGFVAVGRATGDETTGLAGAACAFGVTCGLTVGFGAEGWATGGKTTGLVGTACGLSAG